MVTDDTNALTADEAKYFDTKGQADLPLAETPAEPVEKPAVEKPAAEKPETKADPAVEEKTPASIEVVGEEEIDGAEPDARKYVKVGVVRREREEKQKLRLRAEQAEAGRAELERRLQAMQAPQQPQREPEPIEVVQRTAQELAQLKAQLGENAAKQQFINTYRQKAQEFVTGTADEPGVADFPEAYQHAVNMRRAMFETAGFPPQQVDALMETDEAAIVERAMMDGKNPAQVIYDIARKLGYTPKAAAQDNAVTEQVQRQADTADKTLEAAKKLEKIAKGMDKNKSLKGAGGGNEEPSLEELVNMDEAEFAKHTAGPKFKSLMGG